MNNFELALQTCPKTLLNNINLDNLRQKDANSQTVLMLICQNDELVEHFIDDDFNSPTFKQIVEKELQQTDQLKECALIKLLQCENPSPNHYKLAEILCTETLITSNFGQTACQLAFRNYNVLQFSEKFQKALEATSQIRNYLKNGPGIELIYNKYAVELLHKFYKILAYTIEDSFNVYGENFMIHLLQFHFLHEAIINENQPDYIQELLKKAVEYKQLKKINIYQEGQRQSGFAPQLSELWNQTIKSIELNHIYNGVNNLKQQSRDPWKSFGGYQSREYYNMGSSEYLKPRGQMKNNKYDFLKLDLKIIEQELTGMNFLKGIYIDEKVIENIKALLHESPNRINLYNNSPIQQRKTYYIDTLFPKHSKSINVQNQKSQHKQQQEATHETKQSYDSTRISTSYQQTTEQNTQLNDNSYKIPDDSNQRSSIYHYLNVKETILQLISHNMIIYNEFLCHQSEHGYYVDDYENQVNETKKYTDIFMNHFLKNFNHAFQEQNNIYLTQQSFSNEQIAKQYLYTIVHVITHLPKQYLKPQTLYICLMRIIFEDLIPDYLIKNIIRNALTSLRINIRNEHLNLGALVGLSNTQLEQMQERWC